MSGPKPLSIDDKVQRLNVNEEPIEGDAGIATIVGEAIRQNGRYRHWRLRSDYFDGDISTVRKEFVRRLPE